MSQDNPEELEGSEDEIRCQRWLAEWLPSAEPRESFVRSLKEKLDGERESALARAINSDDSERVPLATPSEAAGTLKMPQARRWKRMGVGFVAAAAALMMIVLWPAPAAYSFEALQKRIGDEAFVQARVVDEVAALVGWMSSSSGLVAVESSDSVAVNVGYGTLARYDRPSGTVQAIELGEQPSKNRVARSQAQVLKLLQTLRGDDSAALRVVNESWRSIADTNGADIELDVLFADGEPGPSAAEDRLRVNFGINSESGLPVWMDIRSQSVGAGAADVVASKSSTRRISLNYPSSGPTGLASFGVPADRVAALGSVEILRRLAEGGDSRLAEKSSLATPSASLILPAKEQGETKDGSSGQSDDSLVKSVTKSTQSSKDIRKTPSGFASNASTRRWAESLPVQVPEDRVAMSRVIDRRLNEVWFKGGQTGSDRADSHTLLRRMYLDLTGRIPRVAEIRAAIRGMSGEEKAAGKNDGFEIERVLDALLDSPDFDSNMAAVWVRWLLPPDVELEQFGGRPAFESWLSDRFADRTPYDDIVHQLLTAQGRVGDVGPVLFTTALEMKPDHLAKQTARTFLGTRIDCAMCHDHPYDTWTQEDFWGYAALFARISRPKGKMNVMSSVLSVRDVGYGEVKLPDTELIVAPKLLGAEPLHEESQSNQRRRQLADWLTAPSNRQFARATVNLLWSHFFGAGLVEPRDDFGSHNPALSPELLDELAEYFVANDYDIRSVVGAIVGSRAYQQTSRNSGGQHSAGQDRPVFDSMPIRWLTAEQLYDCLEVASGGLQQTNGNPFMGLNRVSNSARATFVEQFGGSAGSVLDYQSGIPQALSLMNGNLSNGAADENSSRLIRGLGAPFFQDNQRVETVFLAIVGRLPNDSERLAVGSLIQEQDSVPVTEVLSDLVWALFNGAEFATNH